MLGVIFGAAQPGFFGRNRHEHRRPLRLMLQRGPGARHLDDHGAAGGVIHRAVVNGVAIHRRANSQMIPMRGEDHGFRLELRIAALHLRDHVVGLNLPDLARDVGANVDAERNGLEVARVGGGQHLVDGLAGQAPAVSRPRPGSPSRRKPAPVGPGAASTADLPCPRNCAPRRSRSRRWAWCG